MKMQKVARLLGAVLSTWLAFAGPASAHEHRALNGYHVFLGFVYEPSLEDELNGPVLLVRDAKFKEVPLAELQDTTRNKLTVEALYYGLKDTRDNRTAKPRERLSLGRFQPIVDGALYNAMYTSKPGVYGFRIKGLLNGKQVDSKFVCSRGSLDLPNSYFDCVSAPPVAPGPRIRGWWPN